MPLTELIDTFEHLKNQIATHGDNLKRSETRTRQVLIDPLLRVLGWDVTDPAVVELERGIPKLAGGTSKADYVLLAHPIPLAVIEAKSLGRNLDDDATEQVLTYANREGIDWMIVSDGNVWRMHEVFKKGPLEDRLLTEFTVSEQPASHCAVKSLVLWNPNLASTGGPISGQEPVLVVDGGNHPIPGVDDNGGDDPPPPPPRPNQWTPITERKYETNATRPSAIRFGSDDPIPLRSWKEIWRLTVRWLVDEGLIGTGEDSVVTEWNRGELDVIRFEEAGRMLQDFTELTDGVYVREKDTRAETQWTYRLLDHLNVDPGDVLAKFD